MCLQLINNLLNFKTKENMKVMGLLVVDKKPSSLKTDLPEYIKILKNSIPIKICDSSSIEIKAT